MSLSGQLQGLPVLALGLLAAALGCLPAAQEHQPAAASPAPPVKVKTVAVLQQDVARTTTQPASVLAYYRAEVRAKISGYVKQSQVDIGDFVESGTVLAEVAIPELEKQRQIMEARIASYVAQEKRAAAGVDLAAATIRSAEARLAQAKSETSRVDASLAALEAEFSRTSDLVTRQSLESRVLDEVRKRRDAEQASKAALESAVQSAEAEVAVALAESATAEADLEVARSASQIARSQLEELVVSMDYAALKAPISGMITHRSLEPGDLVREGSEVGNGRPLFVVSQIDKVRIQIAVPETDAALVTRGDALVLRFPSFAKEEPITAAVSRISGGLDPNTRTMLIEADVENPDKRLLPGMFGEATITLGTKIAVNTLPARAVRFSESGQAYVYLIADDESVVVTEVALGLDDGNTLEILDGLSQGQQVIDAHLKRFVTGDKVTVLAR